MKLVVLISMIILVTFTNCEAGNTYDVFKESWCGNSKVDVEIISQDGEKAIVTKASIVVPTSLSKVQKSDYKNVKLIPKTFQGLILYLESAANEKHLGVIYNYDEDDKQSIYIPYLYLSSIEEVDDKFVVTMDRTFNSNTYFTFNIVPQPDSFETNLCDCQRRMLKERIVQNFSRRKDILLELSERIVAALADIESTQKALEDAHKIKIDRSEKKIIEERIKKLEAQHKSLKEDLAKKNEAQKRDKEIKKDLEGKLQQAKSKVNFFLREVKKTEMKLNNGYINSEAHYKVQKASQIVVDNIQRDLSEIQEYSSDFKSWQKRSNELLKRVKNKQSFENADFKKTIQALKIDYETLKSDFNKKLQ